MSAKLIHTLLSRLGMPDDQYRQMLRDRCGAETSRALTPSQQRDLVQDLNALLPEDRRLRITGVVGARRRFENLGDREPQYATPAQLRMLEATCVERSRKPSRQEAQAALNEFLRSRFGIGRIEWVLKDQVGRILKALQHVDPDAPLRQAWTRSRRKPKPPRSKLPRTDAPAGRLQEPTPTTTQAEGA